MEGDLRNSPESSGKFQSETKFRNDLSDGLQLPLPYASFFPLVKWGSREHFTGH